MRHLLAAVSLLIIAACSHTPASQTEVWVGLARPGRLATAAVWAASAPYTQGGPTAAVAVNGPPTVGSVMIRAWREDGGARVQVYTAESAAPDNTSPVREIGSYHLALGQRTPIAELVQFGVEPLTLVCDARSPVER